jgi:hypothetical protein
MTKRKTLLDFMNRMPQALVRVMGVKHNGRGNQPSLMSLDEIAKASGLPRRSVQRLASRKTWGDVKLKVASAFISGCGVDILRNHDTYEFIRCFADKNFHHLNDLQRRRFYSLMDWQEDGK